MQDTIDGVRFEYERYSGTPPTVIFLHGWGGDIRSFVGAARFVSEMGTDAVNIAFPTQVPADWGTYDYAAFIQKFLKREGIVKPIVVGHSFGGRVAIILASQGLCGKLMLVDAAGMKPRFSIKRKIAVSRYHSRAKRGKPLDGMGSIDYNNTSGDMRKVFVRIVNTHLDKLLPYVNCPTSIVWGENDSDTPPYMAKRLHRGIKGSKLIYLNGGHYSYIDSSYGFFRAVKEFITE